LGLPSVDGQLMDESSRQAVGTPEVSDRGPPGSDGLTQHGADRSVEPPGLLVAQGTGHPARMDVGPMERLVGVDVSDSCDPALVE